ncbi:heptahelical transmembrane protein 2 [Phtheirospermum japonicum]|uniref:Heptahelical transmembrane protein 2 n=1 Tax=Phtheirospermum japonicum TaxID=374723 RepID=A0A830CS08_9LAMI|nr:heptahelical transmembrane protein 2 [Phtheirospermum japonicum]
MKRRTAKSAASTLSKSQSATGAKAAKLERRLMKYDELPEYLRDNEFITDYYRCEWPLKDVILSVFSLHNETLNIWTHLVGFLIFLGLMVMSLTEKMTLENVIAGLFGEGSEGEGLLKTKMMTQSNGSNAFFPDSYLRHITQSPISTMTRHSNPLPFWPWLVFLTGTMGCLIFSTVSHLFACHSKRFYFFFWRLDYAGISLMIVSSFFAPIYYTFSDHPYWRLLYLSSITLVGVLVVITLLAPALSAARFRSFRAALFLCMGFSGVIPATHAVVLHWDHPQIRGSLGYEVVMGALYGVGAVFYVTRIPERWRPGAFDVVGHSHQIFHVFVVAAALAHCAATLIIMEWRQGLPV